MKQLLYNVKILCLKGIYKVIIVKMYLFGGEKRFKKRNTYGLNGWIERMMIKAVLFIQDQMENLEGSIRDNKPKPPGFFSNFLKNAQKYKKLKYWRYSIENKIIGIRKNKVVYVILLIVTISTCIVCVLTVLLFNLMYIIIISVYIVIALIMYLRNLRKY